ncbi:4-hydroxybenzoate polyprenyltransferase, mitochondrial [Teratosphaeria destructans]|uniref:4-hydroxybenzoate polyprenyltransferase, mitochondrial n=1 Tax=Teratosphaeria destructans TaxID=418781 RepID=A0A9W7SWP1_9PEZI|nr:4-hydroxybenzoate polyprenyltransferase, mitochondrial [Teratosphaeria destructans]
MATHALTLRLASLLSRPKSFSRTSLQLQHVARKGWTAQSRVLRLQSAAQRRWTATSPAPATSVIPTTTTLDEPVQAYNPPTTGLLGALPRSWVPYAELIRLEKPIGTYYLFLPCLFSTLLAAPLTNPMVPPTTVVGTSLLFFSGALIMRGAGCTINDLWDRNLDPHVSRTRLRPIARKAVTVSQAIVYLGFQLFAGLAVLLQFPWQCFFYATPSLLFVTAYPLAKRVTNYPQFVLGLTFSWGAILGFPALGIDLMSNTPALISAACLYSSCVAWTVVYDMIYAYQDIQDDAKAGIKSIALAQERNGKIFLAAVSAVQVGLLAGAGAAIGAGPLFYFGTCGGAAATLGYMIRKVDLKDVKDCWAWFKKGAWFTGGAISLGLTAEYAAHYVGWHETDRKVEGTNVPKTSWKQIVEWSQGS